MPGAGVKPPHRRVYLRRGGIAVVLVFAGPDA